MKRVINLLILVLLMVEANGQNVTLNEVREFANKWVATKNKLYAIESITQIKSGENAILFNCSLKPSGFIIISGVKSFNPIIGYSFTNKFDVGNLPDPIKSYFNIYEKKIIDLRNEKGTVHPDWNLDILRLKSAKSNNIEPLIQTQWNQGFPYNAYCPNNVPAGCVAVAIAQLMKYYNYPLHGLNKNSYSTNVFGTISADFKNTFYNWDKMTFTTSEVNDEIAKIIYHCGVAVNTDYTLSGSNASTAAVIKAMVDYFGYNKQSKEILFATQDSNQWKETIINEINNSHPVIYGGSTDINFGESHMFIIDGYDEDGLFHINWGWGGTGDGYYDLHDIVWQYRQSGYFSLYPPPVVAAFDVDSTFGTAHLNTNFTDYSLFKTDPITKWEWDFNNDGIIDSNSKNSSYTYDQFGMYSVKLIVSNNTSSDTLIKKNLITIASPTNLKYVSVLGDDINGNGSFQKPFKTIQHAINLSSFNNDIIVVDNGKYLENVDFQGKNILLTSNYYFSKDYNDIINTIIDGNNSGSVVNFDNNENQNAQLIGFTIQNGNGDYVHPHWVGGDTKRHLGGGIRCDNNSSPTLKHLIIKDNVLGKDSEIYNYGAGSAIYAAQNSNIYINNCLIMNNSGEDTGALYLHSSNVKIDSTYIINNKDGGIFSASDNISNIQRCIIANNKCSTPGSTLGIGIHYDYGSKGILSNSIVYNNQNENAGNPSVGFEYGTGGIYMHVSDLKVVNSIIYNNYPDEIVFSGSTTCGPNSLTITNSDLKGGQNSILTNDNGIINWIGNMKDYEPLFIDIANNNYRVENNCGSIDAGTDIFVYEQNTITYIPTSNYSGNSPDIGVFELYSEESNIEKLMGYYFESTLVPSLFDNASIGIYPNPTKDNLYIDIKGLEKTYIKEISIFNIDGEKLIYLQNYSGEKINVSNLPTGIYILLLNCKERYFKTKFIRQ